MKQGHNHVTPAQLPRRLLRVKGEYNPRVSTLYVASSNLNDGDVFVLDLGGALYQWNGAHSSKKERLRALE